MLVGVGGAVASTDTAAVEAAPPAFVTVAIASKLPWVAYVWVTSTLAYGGLIWPLVLVPSPNAIV